jgi:O-antigen ligase
LKRTRSCRRRALPHLGPTSKTMPRNSPQGPSPTGFPAIARLCWRTLNGLAILALSVRFLAAGVAGNPSGAGPAAMLGLAGLALGAWRPLAALFAFTLAVPLLTGLGQLSMLGAPAPVCLAFASLSVGIFIGNAWRMVLRSLAPAGSPPLCGPGPEKASRARDVVTLTGDVLISAVLASLLLQIGRNWHSEEFWSAFLHRPLFGFTDPFYFLTSAFLWLQGLFYFTALVGPRGNGDIFSVYCEGGPIETRDSPARWLAPVFAAYAVVIATSFAYQCTVHIPDTPRGQFRLMPETSLPFEDSHAYGSIAVALFAAFVAARLGGWRRAPLLSWLVAGCLLYLSLASWSRATWMVAAVVLLFAASHRLSKRLWLAIAAAAAALLMLFYAKWRDVWAIDHPVTSRLGNLLRVDQPRRFLYHKAIGMVEARPLAGFGIGACNLTSVQFASPDDPLGKVPDFAHNFLLQIATEQGLCITLLYAAMILWVLARGLGAAGMANRESSARQPWIFGAGAALLAYLATQMTANSLNVYFSNQFFFWFLMAAVASWAFDPGRVDGTANAPGASTGAPRPFSRASRSDS